MNSISGFFLRVKNWQLFPVFVAIVATIFLLPSPSGGRWHMPDVVRTAIFSISVLLLVGWFWSLANFLRTLLPGENNHSKLLLHIASLYAILYIPTALTFFPNTEPSLTSIAYWLNLFHILCMLYVVYQGSRNLVVVESGNGSPWYKYVGRFLLLWFFPVGVWVIQPKINRLFALTGTRESPAIS